MASKTTKASKSYAGLTYLQQNFVEDLFMSLKVIFEKLYPTYSKKLWKFILEESVNLFIQMLLITSLNFTAEERPSFVKKIEEDMKAMTDLFLNILPPKDVTAAMDKLETLIKALTDDPSLIPAYLSRIKAALGVQYNDNCTV